ncbi:hypothetical protein Trco_004311 [Trichoderma cornu-damae]|uniref:Uncharacterized protein n=1 Tax=Trichoderma cornu-damae TaxID=654480 RepID=A0A9P8QRN2_9HYPO|nr:hypothetical protein Trco_004311 [Trichoderma cornu-damae]
MTSRASRRPQKNRQDRPPKVGHGQPLKSGRTGARYEDRPGSIHSNVIATLEGVANLASKPAGEKQSRIYETSKECIKSLQRSMDEYEELNEGPINITKPAEGRLWELDVEDVSKVDKKAMSISLQILKGIVLSGEHANFLRSPARSGDEVEHAAWRWLEDGIPVLEDTWGAAARETLKALAAVTKLLA